MSVKSKNKMFSLSTVTANFASTKKKFKKFGKKLSKSRKEDISKIGDKLKEIANSEKDRVKSIFEEHKKFFKDNKPTPTTETTAIDFYEKP